MSPAVMTGNFFIACCTLKSVDFMSIRDYIALFSQIFNMFLWLLGLYPGHRWRLASPWLLFVSSLGKFLATPLLTRALSSDLTAPEVLSWYDAIDEFNVNSKAECDQLNLAHVTGKNIEENTKSLRSYLILQYQVMFCAMNSPRPTQLFVLWTLTRHH